MTTSTNLVFRTSKSNTIDNDKRLNQLGKCNVLHLAAQKQLKGGDGEEDILIEDIIGG